MSKALIWILIAIVVVAGGIYLATRPSAEPTPTEEGTTAPTGTREETGTTAEEEEGAAVELKSYVVINYKIGVGFEPQTVQVDLNQDVVLRVTADADDTVTVEGYNVSLELDANKQGQVEFEATKEGRFVIRSSKVSQDLGYIVVSAK